MKQILNKILNNLNDINSNTKPKIKISQYELECYKFHDKRIKFEQTIIDKFQKIYSTGGTITFTQEEAITAYEMLCRAYKLNKKL